MRADFDVIPAGRHQAGQSIAYLVARTTVAELCPPPPRPISAKKRFWRTHDALVRACMDVMGIDNHCARKLAWEVVDDCRAHGRTERGDEELWKTADTLARVAGFLHHCGPMLRRFLRSGHFSRTGLTYYPPVSISVLYRHCRSPHRWERILGKLRQRARAILAPWGLEPSHHAMGILLYQWRRLTAIGKMAIALAALTLAHYFSELPLWYGVGPAGMKRDSSFYRWWEAIAYYSISTRHAGANEKIRWIDGPVCEAPPYGIRFCNSRRQAILYRTDTDDMELVLPICYALPLRMQESAKDRIDAAKNRGLVELLSAGI